VLKGWPVHISLNEELLATAALALIVGSAQKHIAETGRFTCVLAGGTTPRSVYELLGKSANADLVDWQNTYLFWGDERAVPPDHDDSNYRMVENALLNYVPIPAENVFRMHGEIDPHEAARQYESKILQFYSGMVSSKTADNLHGKTPVFDLVLLGIGTDGHTASLFPGSAALQEQERLVVAVNHNQPPPPLVDRLTMTYRLINHAKQIVFLVSGTEKASVLPQILGDEPNLNLPAALVKPAKGNLLWLLDSDAAAGLES
jgi:6-phosphogluconolactonase